MSVVARTGADSSARDEAVRPTRAARPTERLWPYFLSGIWFGFVLTKAEAISWFRIQEMFRFESFHMYGILGSAVAVGAASMWFVRRFGMRSRTDEAIVVTEKEMGKGVRYVVGGLTFGLGWGLTGACPGPIFALTGAGVLAAPMILVGALLGTWTYGHLRDRLPH